MVKFMHPGIYGGPHFDRYVYGKGVISARLMSGVSLQRLSYINPVSRRNNKREKIGKRQKLVDHCLQKETAVYDQRKYKEEWKGEREVNFEELQDRNGTARILISEIRRCKHKRDSSRMNMNRQQGSNKRERSMKKKMTGMRKKLILLFTILAKNSIIFILLLR